MTVSPAGCDAASRGSAARKLELRILGIDCGSQITGFGIIESDGTRHQLVETGVIRTRSGDPLCDRLLFIGSSLRELVARTHPDAAAIEDTFMAVNARSALRLTHVRGVAMFVLAEAGLAVSEYTPAAVKASVTGQGRAEKEQVEWMLRALLQYQGEFPSLDASDAVAVAVCHAVHQGSGAVPARSSRTGASVR